MGQIEVRSRMDKSLLDKEGIFFRSSGSFLPVSCHYYL